MELNIQIGWVTYPRYRGSKWGIEIWIQVIWFMPLTTLQLWYKQIILSIDKEDKWYLEKDLELRVRQTWYQNPCFATHCHSPRDFLFLCSGERYNLNQVITSLSYMTVSWLVVFIPLLVDHKLTKTEGHPHLSTGPSYFQHLGKCSAHGTINILSELELQ